MDTKAQLKHLFDNGTNYQKAYLLVMAGLLTSDDPDCYIADLRKMCKPEQS